MESGPSQLNRIKHFLKTKDEFRWDDSHRSYAPSERQPRVSLVQTGQDILLPAKFLTPKQSRGADMEKEVYTDRVLDDFLPKYQLQVASHV